MWFIEHIIQIYGDVFDPDGIFQWPSFTEVFFFYADKFVLCRMKEVFIVNIKLGTKIWVDFPEHKLLYS